MRLPDLPVLGLALVAAACGTNMKEKSATGGAVVGGSVDAGAGAAPQKIEERNDAQNGSGATYSAPASRSTVTR